MIPRTKTYFAINSRHFRPRLKACRKNMKMDIGKNSRTQPEAPVVLISSKVPSKKLERIADSLLMIIRMTIMKMIRRSSLMIKMKV